MQVTKRLKHIVAFSLLYSVGAFALPSFVFAKQAPENEISSNVALLHVKSTFFDEFLVAENAALSNFNKFYIEAPSASFDKRWLKDHRIDVSRRYRENTLKRYAKELEQQLSKAIEKREGYSVTTQKADDVLTIRANIVDLDINGPDSNVFVKKYVHEAGDATFIVELIDPSGNVIARIKDHRETRESITGRLERTSRIENQRDFRLLMMRWSKEMLNHLAMN